MPSASIEDEAGRGTSGRANTFHPHWTRYLWAAMRYVERSPVRAGIMGQAQDYRWSSAPAHCKLVDDYVLTRESRWLELWHSIGDWSHWLSDSDKLDDLSILRGNVERGLPCGSDDFVSELERRTGLALRPTARGRPTKSDPRDQKGVRPL